MHRSIGVVSEKVHEASSQSASYTVRHTQTD